MSDPWLSIATALVAMLSEHPSIQALGLAAVELDSSMAPHPRYPVRPLAYCPRLVLRNMVASVERQPSRMTRWSYTPSLWLYLSRVTGQNHQQQLMEKLLIVHDVILEQANHPPLQQAGSDFVTSVQVVVHDELRHPFDEPRLRVSCGEILLSIQAHGAN